MQIADVWIALLFPRLLLRQPKHPATHVCAIGPVPAPHVASYRDRRLSDRTTAATSAIAEIRNTA